MASELDDLFIEEERMPKVISRVVEELKCPECGNTEFPSKPRRGATRNIPCQCGCVLEVARLPNGKFWILNIFPKGYRPRKISMDWQVTYNRELHPD
jgi:hypothetical protein